MILALQIYALIGSVLALNTELAVNREHGPAPALHDLAGFLTILVAWGPIAVVAVARYVAHEIWP